LCKFTFSRTRYKEVFFFFHSCQNLSFCQFLSFWQVILTEMRWCLIVAWYASICLLLRNVYSDFFFCWVVWILSIFWILKENDGGGWINLWCVVITFINVTMCPQYNNVIEKKILSDEYLGHVFSHSVGCLFTVLLCFLYCTKDS
jgi:hypothetical protein